MAVYPRFSVLDEQFVTDLGIEVAYTLDHYPFTINGKTDIYLQIQYTFKVNDTYVFIDQISLDQSIDEKEIAFWVARIANELKTVLE